MKTIDIFQLVRNGEKKLLIQLKDRYNEKNEFGQTLLHEAVANSQIDIAEILINSGININQQDNNGQTPLHYTAIYYSIEIARKILSNGGNANIRDKWGNNALWTAVFNAKGRYELVELYIHYNADANNINNAKKTPLDFAKQINDAKLLDILVKV